MAVVVEVTVSVGSVVGDGFVVAGGVEVVVVSVGGVAVAVAVGEAVGVGVVVGAVLVGFGAVVGVPGD